MGQIGKSGDVYDGRGLYEVGSVADEEAQQTIALTHEALIIGHYGWLRLLQDDPVADSSVRSPGRARRQFERPPRTPYQR